MRNRTRLFAIGASLLLLTLLLGCGRGESFVSESQLERYVDRLSSIQDVFHEHEVKFQSSYSTPEGGFLEVRPAGDPLRKMTENQLDSLKAAIYKKIGARFPLDIAVYELGEKPSAVGKVTAVDEAGRFLVVGPAADGKLPDAAWYEMAEDAVIEYEGELFAREAIRIGSSVNVWGGGLMLSSYPGQTEGLRLQVTAMDDGEGDLQGQVTALETGAEGERILEVDGTSYRLMPFAATFIGEANAEEGEVQVGDEVRLWFLGYEIFEDGVRSVTQVVARPQD